MSIYKTVETALKNFKEGETYKVLHRSEYSHIVNNEEFCCEVMKLAWDLFPELPEAMRDNNNVARTALKHSEFLLVHVSDRLKDDEAFIYEVMTNYRNEINSRYQEISTDIAKDNIESFDNKILPHCSPRIQEIRKNTDNFYEHLKLSAKGAK